MIGGFRKRRRGSMALLLAVINVCAAPLVPAPARGAWRQLARRRARRCASWKPSRSSSIDYSTAEAFQIVKIALTWLIIDINGILLATTTAGASYSIIIIVPIVFFL